MFVTLGLFELKLRPVGGETVTSRIQRTLTIKKDLIFQGFEQTAKDNLFKAFQSWILKCILYDSLNQGFHIL